MEMSYQALITYVCLGQAFSFARPGQWYILIRIGAGIHSGNVLLDLVRLMDYQLLTYCDTFGCVGYLLHPRVLQRRDQAFSLTDLGAFSNALLVEG